MVKFRRKSKSKKKDKTNERQLKLTPVKTSLDRVAGDDSTRTIFTETNITIEETNLTIEVRKNPIDKSIDDKVEEKGDLGTKEAVPTQTVPVPVQVTAPTKAPTPTVPVPATKLSNSKNEMGGQHLNSLSDFGDKCVIRETDEDETSTDSNTEKSSSEPSWSKINGTRFSVRQPNYSTVKIKGTSAESLYECIGCCAFRSELRVGLMDSSSSSSILPLPAEFSDGDLPQLDDDRLPQMLIVHYQIPSESPSMFCKTEDGKGGSIAFYFIPSKSFCERSNAIFNEKQAKKKTTPYDGDDGDDDDDDDVDDDNITNAIKLFTEFCDKSEDSSSWRSLFKIIADVKDWEKYNPPSFISKLNGKPLLVRKSAEVCRGVVSTSAGEKIRFFEFQINMHKWMYIAKKCMVSLIPNLADMVFDLGFTIEGRTDNELPECILGAIQLKHIDPTNLPLIPI